MKVKFYGYLKELAGKSEDEVEFSKALGLIELFDLLSPRIKEVCIMNDGKRFNPYIKVFKNGVEVQSMDYSHTEVRDGDVIQLLPPIGGG
ncbi:MAG: MoaD/ThiS family protein [Candidatus Bathyarchaeia archaeon]